jgi:hypothetical protein
MSSSLPASVAQALSPLSSQLASIGAEPVACETSASFDNFAVSFAFSGRAFIVVRDRGQYLVSGPGQSELEAAGLLRTFPGVRELAPPLIAWLTAASAA